MLLLDNQLSNFVRPDAGNVMACVGHDRRRDGKVFCGRHLLTENPLHGAFPQGRPSAARQAKPPASTIASCFVKVSKDLQQHWRWP